MLRLARFAIVVAVVAPALAQTLAWERQVGSAHANDFGYGTAVDATGVYVVGVVHFGDALPGQKNVGGGTNAFILKYDLNGNALWTRQFANSVDAYADGVATGGGGVYVVGDTGGTFVGQAQSFSRDAYVRKYDTNGNELWTRQFGTSATEYAFGVAADASGVYVVGETDGAGAAVAPHSDGVTPVTTQNPAKPNEVLVLFGTGLGLLSPSLATGAPSQGNPTVILPGVTVDGISAEVQFAGGAPGFVGLDQINIRIPPGMRTATNIPMVLNIGTKQSNTVTIAVAQ